MKPKPPAEADPVLCARCLAELKPGAGDFYRINIEAMADPAPPAITAEDLEADLEQQIQKALAQMENLSAQDALNQVYRRLTLHLCADCYRQWIENPTGSS
jgi:hypothetical protein